MQDKLDYFNTNKTSNTKKKHQRRTEFIHEYSNHGKYMLSHTL